MDGSNGSGTSVGFAVYGTRVPWGDRVTTNVDGGPDASSGSFRRLVGRPLISSARCLTRNRPSQWLLTRGARRNLIPWPILSRLRVVGSHTISSPTGKPITYVASSVDAVAPSIVWKSGSESYESVTRGIFAELCNDCHLVVDVGAYSGIYSLTAASENPSLEVIALEPNPSVFPLLTRNIEANSFGNRVRAIKAAASDHVGDGTLFLNHDPTQSSLVPGFGGAPQVGDTQIALVTLDDLVEGRRPVDLIKIDVEGAELLVLKGSPVILGRDQPALIVELLDSDSVDSVSSFLRRFGYGDAVPLGPERPYKTEGVLGSGHGNYLFSSPRTAR